MALPKPISEEEDFLLKLMLDADEQGIKLEVTGNIPTWEFHPLLPHQYAVDDIRASLRKGESIDGNGCECISIADVYIRFPDGSLKRPDIAIYCERPVAVNKPVEVIPEAIIEIISKESRYKDLELNPPFYLSMGVKDVIAMDPTDRKVVHFGPGGQHSLMSPTTIELACGCTVKV